MWRLGARLSPAFPPARLLPGGGPQGRPGGLCWLRPFAVRADASDRAKRRSPVRLRTSISSRQLPRKRNDIASMRVCHVAPYVVPLVLVLYPVTQHLRLRR